LRAHAHGFATRSAVSHGRRRESRCPSDGAHRSARLRASVGLDPVGGIAEIIDDGVHGYIVPEKDPIAFADAVAKILGDPAARRHARESTGARA
jgi:hypothetical protein